MLKIIKICYPIGMLLSYTHFRYVSYINHNKMIAENISNNKLNDIIWGDYISDIVLSIIWPISTPRYFADKIAFNLANK